MPMSSSGFSDSSTSTEKSHSVILLSAEATAKTESSLGSNCNDVMASVCHRIRVIESTSVFFDFY